ncbi:MAG: AAA family ATPase [Planctomycetota bacterium]|nr:AAA family ATPase [Planctomycetota bacterium]
MRIRSFKIVAVVGLAGAGKSVVTDAFIRKGWAKVRFGDVTDAELRQRNLPVNEKNERSVREELRRRHGMAAYAILNRPRIDRLLKSGNVVVDGLYSWEEYKLLKRAYGDRLLIAAVYAPPALRYSRLAQRKVRPLSLEEAAGRDFAEIERINKGGPIAMADITLLNVKGKRVLAGAVRSILRLLALER